ncbi:tRNA (adenosine(37)-N6)-threonylcarbamoyltransferase complex ATPase subunit type 1 TsaE [Amaricoccus sp.]|uniref:tRNA (adenosine(37)-N6)-threonylcarbamoyltransferase complex ATPase subunit type 1 TsaE n=1 Tax=Amaricoccus sp. TaxID=1872485 RepID=UPI0025C464E2|nr:tRNA (adenosine(37)-N6)-threonylcarbamoyltransferase complex ATPase subunit type 1 TsaE [Amaricoccus sp.]
MTDRIPSLKTMLTLSDAAATEALARALAPGLGAGDLVALVGGLGVGKSVFARALIGSRLAALGRAESVPSPSYTLVQTYDLGDVELWHADLYRLGALDEIGELGLEEAFAGAITVVEWADRLGPALPPRRLTLALDFEERGEARRAELTAEGGGWDWLPAALAAVGAP